MDNSTLIDAVYSQDVSDINPNIDSLIEQQFSSFYQQYNDFSLISNFLSYRTKAYLKFLKNFTATSKIFPINLRYNLGLSNLLNIKYTQYPNINLYEYITKRGSKYLFYKIAENLRLSNIEQLVLTSVNPYRIVGSESRAEYGTQILTTAISDLDLITEDDIPLYLPIYSVMKNIQNVLFEKFEILILGLLFDKSEYLFLKKDPNTLEELILTYFVIKSIRKGYTPVDEIDYNTYRTKIILPHQVIDFKNLMYQKYPQITSLSQSDQWTQIFRPFITEYPKYTNLFRVNTSNPVLNDQINSDLAKGDFITRLNLEFIDQNNSIIEFDANITSSLILRNPEIKDIYVGMYLLHKNPLYYLKTQLKYRTLYGNLLKYLLDIDIPSIFLVDMFVVIESIISLLRSTSDYRDISVDSFEISYFYYQILSEDFENFRPMNIILTTPHYTIEYNTAIYLRSSITKYPNLTSRTKTTYVKFKHIRHMLQTVKENTFIGIFTSSFKTLLISKHAELIEILSEYGGTTQTTAEYAIQFVSNYTVVTTVTAKTVIDVDLEFAHTHFATISVNEQTTVTLESDYTVTVEDDSNNS